MLTTIIYLFFSAFSGRALSATPGDNSSTPTTSWEAQPNRRGTFQLLVSCLLTLTLCVWTALHVNVPAEGSGRWRSLRIKLVWVLFGIFAPELVVYVAYTQNIRASWLYEEMQHALLQQETSVDDAAARKRRHKKWTKTHSFMALMGGIAYQTSDDKDEQFIDGPSRLLSLSAEALQLLGAVGLCPDIPESQIRDKSKADDFAKGLACVQAAWILIQVVGRLIAHLPITLLEINTIAHVFCALAIYVLWWDKPLDVRDPVVLKREPRMDSFVALMWMYSDISSSRGDVNDQKPEISCLYYFPKKRVGDNNNMKRITDPDRWYPPTKSRTDVTEVDENNEIIHRHAFEHAQDCENWNAQARRLGRKTKYKDRSGVKPHAFDMNPITTRRWNLAGEAADYIWSHKPRAFDIQWPRGLRAFWLPYNQFIQIDYLYKETPNWPGLDLPHYLGPDTVRLILSVSTALYGGLHASAWKAHFPSKYEHIIWISCCLFIAVSGFAVFLWYLVKSITMKLRWYRFRNMWIHMFDDVVFVLLIVMMFYFLARAYLVLEAFISLRNVPEAVYKTPVWTQLIPHL